MQTRPAGALALITGLLLAACSDSPSGPKIGPPASLVITAGDNQSAQAGNALPAPVVAQLRDANGHGVPDVPITFSISEGDGSLTTFAPVITDAQGNAQAPAWTLGKLATPQSLKASTAEGINAVAHATVATNFNVDVRFFGPPMSAAVSNGFTIAAARIKGAIVGDIPNEGAPVPALNLASETDGCGVEGLPTNFSEPVDDVLIYAAVAAIDGPNNVLGFAFPCFIRDPAPNFQTLIGIMVFDSTDIQNMLLRGNFTDVVTHEMLHVVGIGTLWGPDQYNLRQGTGTTETRYTGTNGVNGCIAVGGASVCPGSIPLEPRLGSVGGGTADSHWSESVFFNELMTGFVNTRSSVPTGLLNPFSLMSIQSLADMGYVINTKAADPYTVPSATAGSILGQLNVGTPPPAWEIVRPPKYRITRSGKKLPVVPQ
jgi:hypothetical protein